MGSFTPNLSNYGETKHIWNMHSALSFNSMNQRAKLELALLTFVYMWDLFPSVCTFQNYLDLSFCLYHLHVVKQWQQIIHSRIRTQVVAVGTDIESFIVLKSSLVGTISSPAGLRSLSGARPGSGGSAALSIAQRQGAHADGLKIGDAPIYGQTWVSAWWLSLPLWKMMEFVSWGSDIPNLWKNDIIFQTTSQPGMGMYWINTWCLSKPRPVYFFIVWFTGRAWYMTTCTMDPRTGIHRIKTAISGGGQQRGNIHVWLYSAVSHQTLQWFFFRFNSNIKCIESATKTNQNSTGLTWPVAT
jgi:hypothetical protein